MVGILKKYAHFGNRLRRIAIGSVMTSFLHSLILPTGAKVPGGAFGTDGNQGRLKLVVAPWVCESAPVPTSFQKPARLSGGTVAKSTALGSRFGAVCQRIGHTETTSFGRGAGCGVVSGDFGALGL